MSSLPEPHEQVHDSVGAPLLAMRLSESFEDVVALNPHLRLEQNATGEIVVMTPTGGESGSRNTELTYQLKHWVKANSGIAFDSSTLFCLPNGAKRSPDSSWISSEKWSKLTVEQRKSYPPLCPDFVVELRSESDRLSDLTAKMHEYLTNGALLGWLIDPLYRKVYVFQPGSVVQIHSDAESISAGPLLPGFELDLRPIWAAV